MEKHTSQYEWDLHFMREAKLWMERSKCLSRKVGAILVKDNHILSAGYNGAPKGVPHCDYRDDSGKYTDHFVSNICPRQRMGFKSGDGLEHCVAIHGEINPILQAARLGIPIDGTTLYCFCNVPCIVCSKEIINAGVERVVCLGLEEYQNNGMSSLGLFIRGGVKVDVIELDECSI